jgi:RNA polymerase sigma factor (sigma-70 family)
MARQAKPRPQLDPAMQAFCERETVRLLPFIQKLAICSGLPLPIEDLVQEAAQAVFEALPRFDAGRGLKLETFLAPRIFGAMRDYARRVGRMTKGGARTGRSEFVVSLQSFRYETDGGKEHRLEELLAAPTEASDGDWATLLRGFNRRERLLVIQYFVLGSTMKEIGRDLALSESRVSQMMTELLDRLRKLELSERRVTEALV